MTRAQLTLFCLSQRLLQTGLHIPYYIRRVSIRRANHVSRMVQMLFAEGSNEESLLWPNTTKSVKLYLLILVPAIAVLFALSDRVLLLFGSSYSKSGVTLLGILALSAIPVDIDFIDLSVMKVRRNTKGVIVLSASVACFSLVAGCILMNMIRGYPGYR